MDSLWIHCLYWAQCQNTAPLKMFSDANLAWQTLGEVGEGNLLVIDGGVLTEVLIGVGTAEWGRSTWGCDRQLGTGRDVVTPKGRSVNWRGWGDESLLLGQSHWANPFGSHRAQWDWPTLFSPLGVSSTVRVHCPGTTGQSPAPSPVTIQLCRVRLSYILSQNFGYADNSSAVTHCEIFPVMSL